MSLCLHYETVKIIWSGCVLSVIVKGVGMCQGAYTAQALFASFLAVTDQ